MKRLVGWGFGLIGLAFALVAVWATAVAPLTARVAASRREMNRVSALARETTAAQAALANISVSQRRVLEAGLPPAENAAGALTDRARRAGLTVELASTTIETKAGQPKQAAGTLRIGGETKAISAFIADLETGWPPTRIKRVTLTLTGDQAVGTIDLGVFGQ